jgi:hypothetical protein
MIFKSDFRLKTEALLEIIKGKATHEWIEGEDPVFSDHSENFVPPTREEWDSKFEALKSAEPIRELREERSRLLAETDWTQGADIPEATKIKWQLYRQALRDITDRYTSVEEVIWPPKPTETN